MAERFLIDNVSTGMLGNKTENWAFLKVLDKPTTIQNINLSKTVSLSLFFSKIVPSDSKKNHVIQQTIK